MPKKKLTKARVKAEYRKMAKILAFLAADRLQHPDSVVTMTPKGLFEIDTKVRNAFNRIK